MSATLLRHRLAVAYKALPVIREGRRIELSTLPAAARVAVLVEAAGALAALARRQAHLSHVDPRHVARLVTDPADAMAVLGRGRWLPTMHRPVLAIPRKAATRRISSRRTGVAGQLSLFPTDAESR